MPYQERIFLAFGLFLLCADLAFGSMLPDSNRLELEAYLSVGGETVALAVAGTEEQKSRGLRGFESLPRGRGMLFPVEPPRDVQLWMEGVKTPLDLVFVRNGRVRTIHARAAPCSSEPCPKYRAREPIDRVLELKAGRASKLGLAVGDRISIGKSE